MFQAVPPASDLLSTVPGGRAALSKKSYLPPSPAFKVSTVRPVGEQTPDLTSLDLDGDGDQTSSESDDEEGDEGSSDVESQPEARAVTERYF